ncbi:MAG: S8 family serine peptidase, partial [Fidelibacterota bacterium]
DLIGWDLSGWDGGDDNNPIPKLGVSNYSTWAHGTHVSGLLSATTDNGTGIASTSYNCSIMCVKVSREDQTGIPYITEGYSGILYAAQAGYEYAGFSIQNNSWGGVGFNQYEQATINVAHDTYHAIIVAAGGNGAEFGGEIEQAHYPSSYDNVISVAPLGTNDTWHHWATYHSTIDISSPGEGIRSCVINNNYSSWDGSSMASPIVASTIGLMKSYYPERSRIQLETMILETADPVIYQINSEPYLQGNLGTGRVDAHKAIEVPLFPIIGLAGNDIVPSIDQDGMINGGDVLEVLTIIYTDPDWGTATGVHGILTCDSPFILITSGSIEFPDLLPGDVAINETSPFEIELLPDIPEGTYMIDLIITSNESDWVQYETTLPFEIIVEPTQLFYGDVNNDGVLDVLDIVTMVGFITGQSIPTDFQMLIGDMNFDEDLDVLDIVILVNEILN